MTPDDGHVQLKHLVEIDGDKKWVALWMEV
jgi:hypothetical protein